MKYLFCSLMLFILVNTSYAQSKQAVVCVPVTDLVGHPLSSAATAHSYDTLPLCGIAPTQAATCPRLHQLLFNEQVTVPNPDQIVDGNIHVQIPHLFFITEQNDKPQQSYWMHADHIRFLDQLERNKVQTSQLPPPIRINQPDTLVQHSVVTLAHPFYDQHTKQTYSVGTRFVKAGHAAKDTQPVYLLDCTNNSMHTITIPTRFLMPCAVTAQEKKKQFVQLVKQWAHPKNGFIPYVFGGCSIIYTSNAAEFKTKQLDTLGTYAELPGFTYLPKPGIDCSGLVARAAQLCQLPYFYKNTRTLAHYLPSLKATQLLEAGDLIWIPGHVIVISDIQNNLMVEARSYSHGFGKIHEISLENVFVGIKSYKDLVAAYHKKLPLQRLDYGGAVRETFKEFKLFKLMV